MAQKSTATPKTVEDKKSLGRYFRGVKREFKRVVWPTKKQLFQYSVIVILVSVVTAIFLYAVDFVFSHIMGLIFGL
ncbi:preprotein translocase, SecE subunit [Aedoeadaptatus coxii]|uniref:Protein translocase subunit SecE n=1 Tax=Aedoeadaptatus coxii TaxID=755172 RepID=A0A134AH87_9FIRM|nr:preprotein translocase subunit SecE [Peptoniphilus coxii]KXB66890.1 preprotein translocase, SecE subunit [Peptoniphilus coxii]CAC9936658.1 preprotein translocase, SecE subunit [Peptoniphilus coxii]